MTWQGTVSIVLDIAIIEFFSITLNFVLEEEVSRGMS